MEEQVSDLLTVDQAIEIIDRLPVHPRKLQASLDEAQGLCVAADVLADRDYPPSDKSLMDGYAVRSADIAKVPVELLVVGESAAGDAPARGVGPGEAMTIMTGAALPAGADSVVPIEQTGSPDFAAAGQRVRILQSAPPSSCIARRASDVAAGAVVLSAGTIISAAQIAVAASVGAGLLAVWDRPRCAVLATGNELVAAGQTPDAARIRNSNTPMLKALLSKLGCQVNDLGAVPDSVDQIAAAIQEGLKSDALFVTGGMSMGRYDHVPRVLKDLGGDLKITKLRIRPGKPFVLAAMPGGKYVFGLPGNPVSAYVCTLRLASRLLCRMAGGPVQDPMRLAELSAPLPANGQREFYQPAIFEHGRIRPLAWKGSADIFTLAKAQALIVRKIGAPPAAAGQSVPIIELA